MVAMSEVRAQTGALGGIPGAKPAATEPRGGHGGLAPHLEDRIRIPGGARHRGFQVALRHRRAGGDEQLFRRQVLTGLINLQLLVLEAQRRGITATVAEADDILKRNPFFNPGGKFDAEKFAATKAANSPTYQQTIAELRLESRGREAADPAEAEHTPSDSLLRGWRPPIGQADFDWSWWTSGCSMDTTRNRARATIGVLSAATRTISAAPPGPC